MAVAYFKPLLNSPSIYVYIIVMLIRYNRVRIIRVGWGMAFKGPTTVFRNYSVCTNNIIPVNFAFKIFVPNYKIIYKYKLK